MNMLRSRLLFLLVLAVAAVAPAQRPNIVVIISDDAERKRGHVLRFKKHLALPAGL